MCLILVKMKSLLDLLSYVRSPLVTLVIGVYTLIQSAVVLFLATIVRNRRVTDFGCVDMWARPLLWLNGIKVEYRGLENIPRGGKGVLLLFNHSSHMDIPVLFCLPISFRFGAKIELFKVPFFGRAMRAVGVLPIDRANRNKVMKVYEEAIARINNGESFALAPEGTRQSEPKIGPFKRGPFEFAINAGADILPIVIAGAFEVMPRSTIWINKGRWTRKILVYIGKPIPTAGLSPEDYEKLQQSLRGVMEPKFKEMHAEISAQEL